MISGTFYPDGSDESLNYKVVQWEDSNHRMHKSNYYPSDFMKTERVICHVTGEQEGMKVNMYATVMGPFDSQAFIDDTLAFIFGKDGTLNVTRR